ncbi:MAG TPA: hypothetical protein VN622_15505 [Clostridia bacterium]|nr:hypothetical protein [Clostridia bacterium]
MARGWESKSVDEQQSLATETSVTQEEQDRIRHLENATKLRSIQALKMTRARVVEQLERSANERYNELLKRELAHVDARLAEFK